MDHPTVSLEVEHDPGPALLTASQAAAVEAAVAEETPPEARPRT